MIRPLAVSAAVLLLGACSWVEMEPQGRAIRVAVAGQDLSFCDQRGHVTVSVRDKVGFYERNDLKVRDELEVLARNEAAGLQADTILPLAEPVEGEQRFAAYRCRGASGAAAEPRRDADATPAPRGEAGVETFPLRSD